MRNRHELDQGSGGPARPALQDDLVGGPELPDGIEEGLDALGSVCSGHPASIQRGSRIVFRKARVKSVCLVPESMCHGAMLFRVVLKYAKATPPMALISP